MCRLGKTRAAAIMLAAIASSVVRADIIKICSDVQPIIDFPTVDCGCETLPGKLPVAIFNFAGQPQLTGITGLDFKFTMMDGDTGVGEMDYNKLTLGLGNVDTGLKLNGFRAGQENSLEFRWTDAGSGFLSKSQIDQILADLNDDGILLASIFDATPNDNYVQLYSIFDTSLCIMGPTGDPAPEPASVLMWLGGTAAAAYWKRRASRSRRIVDFPAAQ